MEFNILNTSLEWVGVADQFKSAIWTPRYYDCGDFELYISADEKNIQLLQKDFYVTRPDDDMVGIIEKIDATTDEEGGKYLTVTGRDLKSILGRRIVWQQTNLSGTVEDGIRQLITENVISPAITTRKIDNFILADKANLTDTFDMQVTGDNLLDTIISLCKAYGYGFDVVLTDDKKFMFILYKGEDRSYDQSVNPYVVFSPQFDNLKSVDYSFDKSNFKNVAVVAGEGEGLERKRVTVFRTAETSGLDRYESYVDARDVSTNEGEISDSEYNGLLIEKGTESFNESGETESFEGEIEPSVNFTYKSDYFLGDIVQIENDLKISSAPRIIEIIECEDENGYSMIPTFEFTNEIDTHFDTGDVPLTTLQQKALANAQGKILFTSKPTREFEGEMIYSDELATVTTAQDTDTVILGVNGDFVSMTVGQLKSVIGIESLQLALNNKAPLVHNHDDRYYTEGEVNNLVSQRAPLSHTHDDRYYTEAEMNAKLGSLQFISFQQVTVNVGYLEPNRTGQASANFNAVAGAHGYIAMISQGGSWLSPGGVSISGTTVTMSMINTGTQTHSGGFGVMILAYKRI